ncbi:hypothetical protein Q5752_007072 [Cryptotrichosporon argae]
MEPQDNAKAGPSSSPYSPPTFNWAAGRAAAGVSSASLDDEYNFFRWARWSPDASTVLTTSEDRSFRLYPTPDPDAPASFGALAGFAQPDAIHAAAWYPSASAVVLESFCFAAGVVDHPVRLIDGGLGQVRASYPIVDHRERFIAPHSLAFDPTGTKLYCGFENAIEVFDVSRPGYDQGERIRTTYTRREKGGQKGIISALAFATDYSGAFAAGSFAGSVSVYDADGSAALHLDGVPGGGVTQVAYHPLSPHTLYVASRRSSHLQVYDLRHPHAPMDAFPRAAQTNQRLAFDLDPWGRWLVAGDTDGRVSVWDTSRAAADGPLAEIVVGDDAVAAVQVHPLKPLLLVATGSRRGLYADGADDGSGASSSNGDDDSDSEGEGDSDDDEDGGGERAALRASGQAKRASGGLAVWSFASGSASDIAQVSEVDV